VIFFLMFSWSSLLKMVNIFSDNPRLVVVSVVIFSDAATVDNYN
jgi:hypothetical protein